MRLKLLLTFMSGMVPLMGLAKVASGAQDKPNIIYILADDAGYGDFGCYGGSSLPTPNIDRMAAEGMRFTRHYAGCTVCAPSRCVLMTGLHTGHCRVRGNSPGLLLQEDVTIAEVLKAAGYRTACIGKWGIGAPPPLDDPNQQGFDQFYGYVSMWHAHNFYPEFLIRNGRQEALRNQSQERWKGQDGRGVAVRREDYVPDLLTEEVLKFIREQKQEQPFFLYYALNVPHTNNEGGRFSERPEKGMEVPDFGPYAGKDWPAPEKGFAAMMRNIDRDVGRILDELKAAGLNRNTLVMFTSDNGPHQEGGHKMDFFDSNGPLRGMKRDLYEGGIRVPLIAWWPGTIQAGKVNHHISGFQDMLPTFAKLSGAPLTSAIDGISMVPTLKGQGIQSEHDFLYWEFSEQKGKRAVLKGDWKLLQLDVATANPSPLQLYNVSQDIAEETDLATQHPDIVAELSQLLDAAHTRNDQYPLFLSEKAVEQGQ